MYRSYSGSRFLSRLVEVPRECATSRLVAAARGSYSVGIDGTCQKTRGERRCIDPPETISAVTSMCCIANGAAPPRRCAYLAAANFGSAVIEPAGNDSIPGVVFRCGDRDSDIPAAARRAQLPRRCSMARPSMQLEAAAGQIGEPA